MIKVLLVDHVFNDALVAEDSKLLLERGLLFGCDSELNEGRMDVFHHLE